jgi:hypothetical protein
MEYNIYCDESCHLPKDQLDVMVLGGTKCPKCNSREINTKIFKIKEDYAINRNAEIKWTKVSKGNCDFFKAIIDLFFDTEYLEFRGYIVTGKQYVLHHENDNQTYDQWYYKMYYLTLERLIVSKLDDTFNLYFDIKDTTGSEKVKLIQTFLNKHYHRPIVSKAQIVQSHEVNIMQITDLLIGALSYKNRGLNENSGKVELIKYIELRAGQKLDVTVPLSQRKVNWFVWSPTFNGEHNA